MKAAVAAQRHRARILEVINTLDDNTIAAIARQGQHTVAPDGWPTTTTNDGTPRTNTEYVGVESMADRRAFPGTDEVPRHAPDPTGDAMRQLFDCIALMAKLADTAATKLGYIHHVASNANGRQTTTAGACQCCGREVAGTPTDRLRNGYCEADYRAWLRDGRPERQPWEQQRRRAADINQSVATILDAVANGALDPVTTPFTRNVTQTDSVPAKFDQSAENVAQR